MQNEGKLFHSSIASDEVNEKTKADLVGNAGQQHFGRTAKTEGAGRLNNVLKFSELRR